MAHSKKVQTVELPEILAKVNSVNARLDRIESRLDKLELSKRQASSLQEDDDEIDLMLIRRSSSGIDNQYESRVVENGFAWISAIVYLFGIIFLMAYVRNLGYHLMASIIGYGGTVILFLLSHYFRKSFPHLLLVGQITGLILLYYVTLRLHFFTQNPLIGQKSYALPLLLLTIGIQILYSIRKNNEFVASMALGLSMLTGLFYDSTYVILTLLAATSLASVILFSKYGWWRTLIFVMFGVYLSHALWYLNDPIMGNSLQAVENHQHNILYLFLYAGIFATTISLPSRKQVSDGVIVSVAILNALLFIILMLMMVFDFYKNNYTWIFLLITGLCLLYAVLLKSGTERKFAPAFYACFGFMALSITVFGYSGFPEVYFFLALQSLLVVSMALWFRSKIIVIVNTILFITILLAYLFSSDPIHHISFTFAFVALATARIMNWQRERLTLKTDVYRNIYLISAFFTILYALYHAVPEQYITLSWTAIAVIYFILSVILANVKYRWMAILTILVSSFRLFLVDFSRLETGYRVVAFLFLAIIVLGLSIYYTKKIKNQA